MLTGEQIVTFKRKYGTVGRVSIGQDTFHYRLLTASELTIVRSCDQIDEADVEEAICNWTLLDPAPPVDWEKYNPFLCTQLAETIVTQSGYTDQNELTEALEAKKKFLGGDFSFQIIVALCQTFPSYNPIMLKQFTLEQLMEELALAELVSGKSLLRRKKFNPVSRRREGMEVPVSENQATAMEETSESLADAIARKASSRIPSTGFPVREEEQDRYEQLAKQFDANRQRLAELKRESKS